eukprot:COSAG05_NODE_2360_length_3182_cov_15.581901_4_plen_34_part_01
MHVQRDLPLQLQDRAVRGQRPRRVGGRGLAVAQE